MSEMWYDIDSADPPPVQHGRGRGAAASPGRAMPRPGPETSESPDYGDGDYDGQDYWDEEDDGYFRQSAPSVQEQVDWQSQSDHCDDQCSVQDAEGEVLNPAVSLPLPRCDTFPYDPPTRIPCPPSTDGQAYRGNYLLV